MIKPESVEKIAIIGSGIAGLTAAHLLHKKYQITVFEQASYVGGHAHTIDVPTKQGSYAIDTGFIVFNKRTYPLFTQLLHTLGVDYQASDMSFSFQSEALQLEYAGSSVRSLFAQKRNLLNPRFYRLLYDIQRFHRDARDFLTCPDNSVLREFLSARHYSEWLWDTYVLPMTAAIWSSPPGDVLNMPARFMLQFYQQHGLLSINDRPQWYVITGGSREYVKKIIAPWVSQIQLNTPVRSVLRDAHQVTVVSDETQASFDAVVFACHADQALALLTQPTVPEREILSALRFCDNRVVLHTDNRVLPRQRPAWASWNYHQAQHQQASLTYYMNQLQGIQTEQDFCVSVNHTTIAEDAIIAKCNYTHPIYSTASLAASARHEEINHKNRSYYVGAYWGNGFHEDGVVSSLQALAPFGVRL